jgi:hypothetical protein
VQQPPLDQGLLIHGVSRSQTTTQHSRYDSSVRAISSSQRPPPDKTQQLQQADIHAPGGIRPHNLSRREAADLSFEAGNNFKSRFYEHKIIKRSLHHIIYAKM